MQTLVWLCVPYPGGVGKGRLLRFQSGAACQGRGQGGLTRPGNAPGAMQYRLRCLAEDQAYVQGGLFRITGTLPKPKQDRQSQRAAEAVS